MFSIMTRQKEVLLWGILGFLLIDKPLWISSFDVIKEIKKKLKINKCGHTWTLDPLATWLMYVWAWEATKFISFHTLDTKTYIWNITLGSISRTYDWEWPLTCTSNNVPSLQNINEVLEGFKGNIKQIPPIYSAIKIEGERLYNLARKWEVINIPPRSVTIHSLNIISYEYPNLEIEVKVSSWTYIRSLANDIWRHLWTWAYLSALRRIAINDLNINNSITLDQIEPEKLLPIDTWLKHLPILQTEISIIQWLYHGKKIAINKPDWVYRIYVNNNFFWIGWVTNNILRSLKLIKQWNN